MSVDEQDWMALNTLTEALADVITEIDWYQESSYLISTLKNSAEMVRSNLLSEVSCRHGEVYVCLSVFLFADIASLIHWDGDTLFSDIPTKTDREYEISQNLLNVGFNIVCWNEQDIRFLMTLIKNGLGVRWVECLFLNFWLSRPDRTFPEGLKELILKIESSGHPGENFLIPMNRELLS